jgi:hypothetical protein
MDFWEEKKEELGENGWHFGFGLILLIDSAQPKYCSLPWAALNFLTIPISISVEDQYQSEWRFKYRISIEPTYFDICCVISIKVMRSIEPADIGRSGVISR